MGRSFAARLRTGKLEKRRKARRDAGRQRLRNAKAPNYIEVKDIPHADSSDKESRN
jgi:hypothetical protein